MNIKLEVEVKAQRDKLWELFADHKNLPQWQMNLKKVTEEKGGGDTNADPNEVFLLHYKIGDKIQIVRETISEAIAPKMFQAVYEHPRIPAHVVSTNTFIEDDDVTIWQAEQYITFTRWDYRLFGGLLRSILKHQQTQDMLRFKDWSERQVTAPAKKQKRSKKKSKKTSRKKKKK